MHHRSAVVHLVFIALTSLACDDPPSTSVGFPVTGLYEATTTVLEDSCGVSGDGEVEVYVTYEQTLALGIDASLLARESSISMVHVLELNPVAGDTNLFSYAERRKVCGADYEASYAATVEPYDESIHLTVTEESRGPRDCGDSTTSAPVLPATSCKLVRQIDYTLLEPCPPPCELVTEDEELGNDVRTPRTACVCE